MSKRWFVATVLSVMLASHAAATDWRSLPSEQRKALANYESAWSGLSAEQQQRLALGSERWLKLDDEQRTAMVGRFQRWQKLTPERRELLMRRLEDFRQLSPQQQRRVRSRLQRFNKLSPRQRQDLRKRFQQLPPEQRARALERMKQRARQRGATTRRHRQDVLGMELVAPFRMHGVDNTFHGFLRMNDESRLALVQNPQIAEVPVAVGRTHAGNPGGP